MVRSYISNDIDLVQPTQYPTSKSRVAKKPPPAPGSLLSFTERLTACIYSFLISAHGAQLYGRIYQC